MLILAILGFIICCAIVIWTLTHNSSSDASSSFNSSINLGSLPGKLIASLGTTNVQTKVIFNGKEYSSPDDMPPEIRAIYDRAMNTVLSDGDGDGILDVFQGKKLDTHVVTGLLEDPAESLKKLKELNDAGLINDQEFETKKAEILSRL